ncbi:MAG: NAD(P)H-dependent oxidoreductase subunit E [Anaerolineae bacterium]|jgi:NADH-quinone oxidoreductase subunit E|nr:NAD(P)H-dependent oxidoreductase subunit E [Anaerolineae bacterium]
MSLAEKYPQEIEKILAKYPPEQKRSAVMALLYMAMREEGYVSKADKADIAELLDMTTTEISGIIGFYSLFHDEKAGRYRLQVCTDIGCALRGADQYLADLCKELGVKPGETTKDGLVTIEEVKCLAACDKAPMFQVQSPKGIKYHEEMTIETTINLIEELRKDVQEAK